MINKVTLPDIAKRCQRGDLRQIQTMVDMRMFALAATLRLDKSGVAV
jgi:hypothetical protein